MAAGLCWLLNGQTAGIIAPRPDAAQFEREDNVKEPEDHVAAL